MDNLAISIRSATARNRPHSTFCYLPVEIQVMCWLYLPFSERYQLAQVCTHWRDASLICPQLWTHLHLYHVSETVQPLFARSGNHKIWLTITVRAGAELARVPDCLHLVAPRLYDLRLVFEFPIAELLPLAADVLENLFRYPAPVLNHLSIVFQCEPGYTLSLPPDAFDACAPNLRSVDLHGIMLPDRCPAMGSVQTVWIGASVLRRHALFDIFPAMASLGIDNPAQWNDPLPRLPARSRLEEFTFLDDDSSDPMVIFSTLYEMTQAGYLDLPRVTLQSPSSRMIECSMIRMHRLPDETLTINGDGTARLCNGSGHRTTIVLSGEAVSLQDLQRFFEMDCYTTRIQHLVIPLYFPGTIPLVSRGVVMPHLLTLTITCGDPGRFEARGSSLLDPLSGFGVITAPSLKRLEIRRESGYAGIVHPIDAAHVAHFVRNCLQVVTSLAFANCVYSNGSNFGYSGWTSFLSPSPASVIVSASDVFQLPSGHSVELCMDIANGVQFLGRTTLPRYLLSRDYFGDLNFEYE